MCINFVFSDKATLSYCNLTVFLCCRVEYNISFSFFYFTLQSLSDQRTHQAVEGRLWLPGGRINTLLATEGVCLTNTQGVLPGEGVIMTNSISKMHINEP